jgi:hypothetical protein
MMMSENDSISRQEKITWRWKRVALVAVPVVAILVVIMVLQPWSIANKFHSDITKAHAVMSDVESCRIVGSSTSGGSEGPMSQLGMEGGFTSPDRFYMEIVNKDEVSEFIIIGEILFVTDESIFSPSTFAFMTYFDKMYSDTIFSDDILLTYPDMLTDIQRLPNEEIAGVSCIHYLGQWDVEIQMAAARQGMIEAQTAMGIEVDEDEIDSQLERINSTKISTEFWIGSDDYLIKQMRTDIQYPDNIEGFGISTSSMTATYYDFNEAIVIAAPVDDDGQLLPGWYIIDLSKGYTR